MLHKSKNRPKLTRRVNNPTCSFCIVVAPLLLKTELKTRSLHHEQTLSLASITRGVSKSSHPPRSQDKIATFLAGKRNAILATIKQDGSPQLTPVWYRWDGEQFWVSITKERAKYKNVRRDPRVSLCVDDAETFTTVMASGKAR